MNSFKTILFAILVLLSGNTTFSQQIDQSVTNQTLSLSENTIASSYSQKENIENTSTYNMLTLGDTTLVQQNTVTYPPVKRDYTRLSYNTAMYVGATVIAFGVLYAMPESVTNWDKEAMKENGITYKWKQNVKAGPVWDNDDWVLNWVTHPYSGGVYYMTARSSGFNIFESFLYSAFMSTFFWEYGIEAFAEIPSKQDLIITPVLGSVVGEGFFYAKKSILRHDKKVLNSKVLGYTSLFLIDPFNTLLDSFGYKETTTQLNLAPIGFDKGADKAIWGLNFSMQF
ncbi:DUF3943 domain-containing protein [Flavobacterium taihuense]|uniref:DUF3943 domain-containing protein n=1 Tax=Flavobacterium taihuense TaxID=2857508 RepID=A0ABS6XY02_9FLAO|nr:DUF3943 domain-containing protein [Flavobacterium taihuense]MBW4361570.1 DUF3943 domain-containing protein [Flavobacterium taihuense]